MSASFELFYHTSSKLLINPFTGQLVENRIFIHDILESRTLFGSGYFGKPLGISKPKNAEFDAPIVLDLIEGYYLCNRNRLKIFKDSATDVEPKEILRICTKQYVNFEVKYVVFENLRDKGYIVTPGI